MLRPIVTLAAVGLAGVIAVKLLWLVLLPVVAGLVGFAIVAIKLALIVAFAYLMLRLFRKISREVWADR